MVPTTRSRGAPAPTHSNDDEVSSNELLSTSAKETSKSAKNKVYRKAPPKPDLQQLQFPAKKKTVRAKKTRHSLPNPTTSATKKGGKGKSKKKQGQNEDEDEDEDLKQKTLTQMRWSGLVPSTFLSDDEGMDDLVSEGERLVIDLTAEDGGEAASASSAKKPSATKEKKAEVKQPRQVKKATNRGRKRRKTTGDLELDSEGEDDEEEREVSSSKYHTQTLTQMPSWKGLAEMVVGDSDEEFGFMFEDNLPAGAPLDGATPTRTKRKRSSPIPDQDQQDPASQHALPQPPESTAASSVIPETPSRQRPTRTEIPSSQPSPFTPNLDVGARYWSPLGAHLVDRTPLKERSTNVDAPTPTVRKRRRSEIPDSWSTVNGGMPSSSGSWSTKKREPLKEIDFANVSVELGEDDREEAEDVGIAEGEDGKTTSQKTADDIIMDSDDEFEGFHDDDDDETPGTCPPRRPPLEKPSEEGPESSTPLENYTTTDPPASRPAIKLGESQERSAEATGAEVDEVVYSTPAEQVTAPEEVTSNGLRTDTPTQEQQNEIIELEAEEDVPPTPSIRKTATQQFSSCSVITHHSPTPEPSTTEKVATPTQTMRQTATQPASSHPATDPVPTREIAAEDNDTEPETPTLPRRRPSISSAIEKETPLSSPQKTSPAVLPLSQLGYKSQAFESQRVPFEIIRQMAPQTHRSDVIVSADSDEVSKITDGAYTHIFRDFRIPKHVVRIWIYITAPVCQLKYMAAISDWKIPGDIRSEDQGLGSAAFNAGEGTKYANELLQVYELNNAVSLERMKEDGWVEQAPLATGFEYIPPAPLGALMGNLRWALFEDHSDESQGQGQGQSLGAVTVSQELAEQLRSDIEHSTQLMRAKLRSSPTKQSPHSPQGKGHHDDEQMIVPSSQDVMEDRIRATPIRTRFSSKKQVVFAKPRAPPSRSPHSMDQVDDSPPATRRSSPQSQRIIIKSTVRPSQATTMSAPSQSQPRERTVEYCRIPDSPSPARQVAAAAAAAADKSSSVPMVVDDSPIHLRMAAATDSSGPGPGNVLHTQSSLGLGTLLGSSQGFGLAGIGGEQDSLMDDSRIRMPPGVEEVVWDSEGE